MTTLAEKRQAREVAVVQASSLWPAFAAAQAEFGPIIKSAKGAHKASYAPLDVVLEQVRPVLLKHGLALSQATFVADGTLYVRTSVVHVGTAEMHSADYPAGLITSQHQTLGAGVTYARRYSLLSILGVFPENEDDDGEKAGAAGGVPQASPPPRQQQTNASQAKKSDVWPRFVEKLRSFTDLDELERWWASAQTQAAVDAMPGQWPEQAHEEYEKKQEALMQAGAP